MNDLTALPPIAIAPPTRAAEPGSVTQAPDRQQLKALAEEFEALLLLQVMRQMRQAIASFGDEDEDQAIVGDLGAMTDTIDGELARYLSRAGGFGLAGFLDRALSLQPGQSNVPSPAPAPDAIAVPRSPDGLPMAPNSEGSAPPDEVDERGESQADGTLAYAGAVTSAFGWRTDPIDHGLRFHAGVDIRAAYGQDVPAAGEGRVVVAGEQGSYGLTVVVEHPAGLRTRYAHLSSLAVREGDQVAEGQAIGRAGQSGRARGPHVHLELTREGRPLDPAGIVRPVEFKKMAVYAD
jgi:murein DD-endopeptidase MepM/ murein hydrolase activator NlpD